MLNNGKKADGIGQVLKKEGYPIQGSLIDYKLMV